MAHEVESMMYLGEVPWHGLGRKVNHAPTSLEAMKAAGLDWSVEMDPIYTPDGVEIVTHKATRRNTDGRVLGVVSAEYKPLQNAEAFAWFDPFVASGEAGYECAGALRNGSRVWVLAKLNREDSVIVPKSNDRVSKYVMLSNGHDGSLAVRVGFTPIRVVCANTLRLAHGDNASKLIKVRHTSNVAANLEAIRSVMDMANAEFEATAEQYRALAARQISRADLKRYVANVFELGDDGKGKDDMSGRVYRPVAEAFESGRGNDMPGVKGTWWAAYNAVTEYLSHERGSTEETRMNSLWYGDGARTNQRALDVAYNYVRVAA